MKSKFQIANIFSVLVILAMLIAPVSTVSFAASTTPDTPDGTPSAKLGGYQLEAAEATVNLAESSTGVYIVQLKDPALASYAGGISGLSATSPLATGARHLDVNSSASKAYANYLQGQQSQAISAVEQALGRSVEVTFHYLNALNGFAVRLDSSREASRIAALPGVMRVFAETVSEMATDVGPAWIGAPDIWNGVTTDGVASKGEGVVVGILDSGINHDHPSFATTGEDGYTTMNPYGSGNYTPGSYCDTTDPTFCNDKLIGAWYFIGTDPEDNDSHGSHTASTTAGNVVTSTLIAPTTSITATISGVAPHANIIAYKVCEPSCPSSSIIAAVNQAIADGVDVINFSISGSDEPWADPNELAFLDAFNAGVYVNTSAGNSGPGPSTLAHSSPWNASTGAATHNRNLVEYVQDMSGGNTTPPADIKGTAFTSSYGPAEIVYAGDYGDALCLNPFPASTFNGEIVVCDRGINARVDKGANVLAGGAGGYILANDAANGNSLVTDAHFLPAVHIGYDDGMVLEAWIADGGASHMGSISGTILDYDPSNGDILASFSSRGPSQYNLLNPDYVAPGVAIWAATCCGEEYGFLSGTSMASPHAAGSAALMVALHPDWSPAKIKSALSMTAFSDDSVRKEDGVTPADPFDSGLGRISLGDAGNVGLVMDESGANMLAADPNNGGDPTTLNLPGLQNNNCLGSCSWTRTVSSTVGITTTWTITYEIPAGMGLTVSPMSFTLAPYGTQAIDVTVDVSGLPTSAWAFAQINLSETSLATGLTLDKSDGGMTAEPGVTVPYTLTYGNTGNADAFGVVLYETVPTNSSFNAAASSAGWEWVSGDDYMYNVGALAPGGSGDVVFAVDVNDPFPEGVSMITNTAMLASGDNMVDASDTTPVMVPQTGYSLYLPLVFRDYTGAALAVSSPKAPAAPTIAAISDAHMTLAVMPVTGQIPDSMDIVTRRNAGSQSLADLTAIEISDLTVDVHGFSQATVTQAAMSQDPTNGDPYDNLNDGTTFWITHTVTAGDLYLIAEIVASESPDIDMYVGLDANNNGPEASEEVCVSASGTAFESCTLTDPAPGTYWILVQDWEDSGNPPDAVTLNSVVVSSADQGNMTVDGPASVPAGTPFGLQVFYDLPGAQAGDAYYGAFDLGTDAGNPGNIGRVLVTLSRMDNDVVKTVSSPTAMIGDTVTYTITVNGNVTPEDLTYWLTDTIPVGMTYVPGSATATAGTVDVMSGTLTWNGVMVSPNSLDPYYEVSTSDNNPSCDTGFGGYVNLQNFGIFPQAGIVGDTVGFTAFTSGNPINYYGVDYTGMSFTDDGFAIEDYGNNIGATPWVVQTIPDPALTNNVLPIYWNDFEIFYDAGTNQGVSLATAGSPGGVFIIEYDDIEPFGGGTPVMDFEMVMSRAVSNAPGDYEIVYAYDNVASTPMTATIGVENASGTSATALVNHGDPTGVVSNGFMVCFDYVQPTLDPVTITFQATLDGSVTSGTITNLVYHSNDNPGSQIDVASADVTIPTLVCNAATVDFESGLPTDWPTIVTTGPVYWSTTADLAACDNGGNQTVGGGGSGSAACADSDQTNQTGLPYDTEMWTNAIDLSSFSSATLSMAAAYNDITASGGDMFQVDVWDGSTWTNILSWDEDHYNPGVAVNLNLDAYAGMSNVVVRFHYFGTDWDWWAQVDNVSLTCAP